MKLIDRPCPAPLAEIMAQPPGDALRLYWLGQAGFVIDGSGKRVVIDAYLSDSLAQKYRGKRFPHIRMHPAPITPGAIRHVDLVLATHAHTDHLDPGTLPTLLAANPGAQLVVPRSARAIAAERSRLDGLRLLTIDAGETLRAQDITIAATRAAHEEIAYDEVGNCRFLGLAMTLGDHVVFHSGDTIPFAGQAEEISALAPEVVLFPVNGRDTERASNGVPGNMTLAEAIALARTVRARAMIGHHFDLFDFNTIPRAEVEAATTRDGPSQIFAATPSREYAAS